MSMQNAASSAQNDQGTRLAVSVERVFRPFIRLIVGRVSCGFLIQQLKRIYIEEARRWIEQHDPNGRVTKSKLALLTGLDTRTISSFEENAVAPSEARVVDLCAEAAVLETWSSQSKYRDASDKPAVLPILGRGISFQSLVTSTVGRNVTAQTVLDRLLESNNVEVVDDDFVRLLNPFFQPIKESEGTLIEYGTLSASRLLDTVYHNLNSEDRHARRLQQSRWSVRVRRDQLPALEAEMRALVERQIVEVEELLIRYEQPDDGPGMGSFGVGWFFFKGASQ